jgi:hypothetical protein
MLCPRSAFGGCRLVPRRGFSRSAIWANLTPNEPWAFLSGVAQRLTCPSGIGNRLCFVCHSAFFWLRKPRLQFYLRPAAKNAGEDQCERPGCSTKLGRFYKGPQISNGRHVPARAQGSWNTLMRQRYRFADAEWWNSRHGGSVRRWRRFRRRSQQPIQAGHHKFESISFLPVSVICQALRRLPAFLVFSKLSPAEGAPH